MANPFIITTLHLTPLLSRIYRGVNANPSICNTYRPTPLRVFSLSTNLNPPERSFTPMSEYRICEHIKTNGTPCGCPAMRHVRFCYFHQRERGRTRNLLRAFEARRAYF